MKRILDLKEFWRMLRLGIVEKTSKLKNIDVKLIHAKCIMGYSEWANLPRMQHWKIGRDK